MSANRGKRDKAVGIGGGCHQKNACLMLNTFALVGKIGDFNASFRFFLLLDDGKKLNLILSDFRGIEKNKRRRQPNPKKPEGIVDKFF